MKYQGTGYNNNSVNNIKTQLNVFSISSVNLLNFVNTEVLLVFRSSPNLSILGR